MFEELVEVGKTNKEYLVRLPDRITWTSKIRNSCPSGGNLKGYKCPPPYSTNCYHHDKENNTLVKCSCTLSLLYLINLINNEQTLRLKLVMASSLHKTKSYIFP